MSATQLFAPQHTRPLPQPVPSDGAEREQLSDCVVVRPWQLPLAQARVVTERERVPVVSHAFENPPQPDHAPVVVEPHESPSVSRVHASCSEVGVKTQVPSMHIGVITVRVRVPLSPHVDP